MALHEHQRTRGTNRREAGFIIIGGAVLQPSPACQQTVPGGTGQQYPWRCQAGANYNRLGTSLNTSDRNAGVQDLTRVGFLAHRQSRCREMSQLFEIFA